MLVVVENVGLAVPVLVGFEVVVGLAALVVVEAALAGMTQLLFWHE